MEEQLFDVVILGGGPAGLTAGIYTSRARLRTLILNEGTTGGQLVLTHEIANYPGVESISGFQLGNIMKKQAVSFGCTIRSNVRITGMRLSGSEKQIEVNGREIIRARAVILAPGGQPRMLNIPGETGFKGRGVSYCATCDGDFFTGKKIVVVGGGNSALEEAVSLTKYASEVTVVHQFDQFQAFPYAVAEAKANPKIRLVTSSVLKEILGDETVKGVRAMNTSTGLIHEIEADGVFIFIGYVARTAGLEGHVELNQWGEIIADADMQTSQPGVFAAGDAIAKKFRQVTTAVGEGTIAALGAANYLKTLSEHS